jgi:hypothetical protein
LGCGNYWILHNPIRRDCLISLGIFREFVDDFSNSTKSWLHWPCIRCSDIFQRAKRSNYSPGSRVLEDGRTRIKLIHRTHSREPIDDTWLIAECVFRGSQMTLRIEDQTQPLISTMFSGSARREISSIRDCESSDTLNIKITVLVLISFASEKNSLHGHEQSPASHVAQNP